MKNKELKNLTSSILYKRFRQTVILDIITKRFSDYFLSKNNIPKENSAIFFKNLSKYFQFVDFANKTTSGFFFTKFFGSAKRKKVLNSFDLNSLSFQKFDEYSFRSKQNYSRLYFYFEICFFFFKFKWLFKNIIYLYGFFALFYYKIGINTSFDFFF